MLEADYADIKHICDELEQAVAHAKAPHSRRMIKYIN
jgi:hypothetical protein